MISKLFIPDDLTLPVGPKELFLLVRPFYTPSGWANIDTNVNRWHVSDIEYTSDIREADCMLLPYSINDYVAVGMQSLLSAYNQVCADNQIKGFGFISGDWGKAYPEYEHLTYFRSGGFRSTLSEHNQGFPASLSDQLTLLYNTSSISVREYDTKPVIGFCGHASTSLIKKWSENLKIIRENIGRFFEKPARKDWEPFFPSAFRRASLMYRLEQSEDVKTNFVYRRQYRAGATTEQERAATTKEYYDNIRDSDYVLCVRGGGNFSVRLYETLMMGRVPVFVNTDCLLPFPHQIMWKEHLVWVEWKDRGQIAKRVSDFHKKLDAIQFKELQLRNRSLWKDTLSVSKMLKQLSVETKASV